MGNKDNKDNKGNRILLKLSIIISLLGILALLFLSSLEPELAEISELNISKAGKQVKIQGEITQTRELSKNFYILTIKDSTGQIGVTLAKNFSSNKTLEITGKLSSYKNEIQIQADRIMEK